ncbi:MAG: RnfABCDGE type electron transport complex subunit B [Clostridia bacterium]|nr:RnfABCDGE type electron transport complex subunit B [Clostridia bacterium]
MKWEMVLIALGVLAAIGVIFGLVLEYASKRFAVETDERVNRVRSCLGGANCGACGFAGCDAFAAAVVAGEASVTACTPGGEGTARAIADILGVSAGESGPRMVGHVFCQGTSGIAKDRYEYQGISSCRAAAGHSGGPKLCRFACLGLGDCVSKCSFGAISIADGVAVVDPARCKGCGACAQVCPRGVIKLVSEDDTVNVYCRNTDTGRTAVEACMRACVACKRCEKECKYGAIKVENGVAVIDHGKCTRCGVCVEKCPRHCIVME